MRIFAARGYLIGLVLMFILIALLSLSETHQWRMPGPLNTGHEELECRECHEMVSGSFRQQIQANLSYLFGQRKNLAAFNFTSPNSKDCLACHSRDNDNHPIYRFNEPRFIDARKAIAPQRCVSCHTEHQGVRVTSQPDNCQYCHEEINVKNDPLDISHADLITLKNWQSCLRCHDFHGNHVMNVVTKIKDMKDIKLIEDYFAGGEDPYSIKKHVESQTTRYKKGDKSGTK